MKYMLNYLFYATFYSAELSLPIQITPCDLFFGTRSSCGNTQDTHTTEHDLFWCAPPLALHLHMASFLPDFPLHWSFFDCVSWCACNLEECWMWWWTATACGLDKMCVGRRRFWVMSEKCQGVLWMSISPIFCFLLTFIQQPFSSGLCCGSVCRSVYQKASLLVLMLFTCGCFFQSPLHMTISCPDHCAGFNKWM